MKKKFIHLGCGRLHKDRSTPEFSNENWDEIRVDIEKDLGTGEQKNVFCFQTAHATKQKFTEECV